MHFSICVNATVNLFDPNDTCSENVRQVNNDFNDIIDENKPAVFMGNCPARFRAYITSCLPSDTNVSTIAVCSLLHVLIKYVVM